MVGSPEGTEGGQGAGPEEVVTLCWERKSAGRVGVNGGEGMSVQEERGGMYRVPEAWRL